MIIFFFFNDTATTEIYTLSLHDALPISPVHQGTRLEKALLHGDDVTGKQDRKSTRLNSSHSQISYAVFCLKKKKKSNINESFTLNTRDYLDHFFICESLYMSAEAVDRSS